LGYLLIALFLARAVFSFVVGLIGEGIALIVVAAVAFVFQGLLERDARNVPSGGQDTIF
jgi:hypothetical protein